MSSDILVVEDEPAIQELIAVNLEHAGHRVQRAHSAAEADALMAEKKALLDFEVKTRVAEMTGENDRKKASEDKEAAQVDAQSALFAQMAAIMAELARPKVKVPVRDEQGLIVRVEEV